MRTNIVGLNLKPLYMIVSYFEYHVFGHALRTFHVLGVLVSTLAVRYKGFSNHSQSFQSLRENEMRKVLICW